MAEEAKLVLNNRGLGMSVDEYTGGSFYYAEGIDVQRNSKSFTLGNRVTSGRCNTRANGYANALAYKSGSGMLGFTQDGYMESSEEFTFSALSPFSTGGALYRTSGAYVNGIQLGTTTLGLKTTTIDRITGVGLPYGTNIITNPSLTSNTGWTVGAGWTTGATGAVHSSGTAVLSQAISVTWTNAQRIVVKMTGCTAGTCQVRVNAGGSNTLAGTLDSTSDLWSMFVLYNDQLTADTINLNPSNDFNGTIEFVGMYQYDMAKLFPDNIIITSAARHPLLHRGGYLYVGSGPTIDVIDITTRTVESINVIDSNYNIIGFTTAGNSIVIRASDGNNGRQYYWNGVDEFANEVIEWNGINISNVCGDGVKAYVVANDDLDTPRYQRLYVVSGYDRQLLAKYRYLGSNIYGKDFKKYHPSKRFEFYTLGGTGNNMIIFNDTLFVGARGGAFTYGNDTPLLPPVWNKDVILDTEGTYFPTAMGAYNGLFWVSHRGNGGYNYIGYVEKRESSTNLTGYLVTMPIIWDLLSSEKLINKLKIGFRNLKSTRGDIKIHAIVDDDYFWTFNVTGVTTTPSVGSVYNSGTALTLEVISTSITGGSGTVTTRAITKDRLEPYLNITSLGKIFGIGDSILTVASWTNMALIKTITSDNTGYGEELIFGNSWITSYMPTWHKLQLVFELTTTSGLYGTDIEIYDVGILSDIVNQDV